MAQNLSSERIRIIQFQVIARECGYEAEGISFPIVAHGPTLDAVAESIQEAVGFLAEDGILTDLGFDDDPVILMSVELEAPGW